MKKAFLLAALIIMGSSTVLAADTTTKSVPDKNYPPHDGKMMPPPPCDRGDFNKGQQKFEKRLNLTEAQKAKLKANNEANRAKLEPLMQQIRQKKATKMEIIKKYEEKDADLVKLNKEIASLKAKCDAIREENKKYFESILTAEQKAELAKMKEERKNCKSRKGAPNFDR